MTVLLQLYRGASRLAAPLAELYLRRRLARGKEERGRLHERRGEPALPRPPGHLAWLHGASVGESLSLLPLIERLRGRGVEVLVTTGTVSSARVMASRLPAGARHQFVPIDTPGAVRGFLAHWRPDIAILAESELWPNMIMETRRRAIPLVLVNARMSERSFGRWRHLPAVIGPLLRACDLCLAQSADDASRLLTLGAPRIAVTGNLKFDAAPAPVDEAVLTRLRATVGSRPVWLAASTHADEEPALLDVHRLVRDHHPELLTILVPRHADRANAIMAAASARGIAASRRSEGGSPDPGNALYVADTMGELGLFYRLAPVVFVGKSLGGGGGQNPLEPARLGCAILHGPAVANFRDIYALLDTGRGAVAIAHAEGLARAIVAACDDPATAVAMGQRAVALAEGGTGATDRTMAALEPWLGPPPRTVAA